MVVAWTGGAVITIILRPNKPRLADDQRSLYRV